MIRSRLRRAVRSAALITGLLASVMFASEAAASSDTTDSQTYTNHLMGFSITAPADWRISETGRRLPVVQLDPPGYTNFVSVQVSVHRHVGPDTTREWTDWQVSNYGKRFVTIHEESHVSLGPDTSGFRAVFEWHGELGIKEGWTGVLRGRQDFIIRAFGTATDFDRLRDTVDEIIRTFTLLTPDPTQAPSDAIFVLLSEEPDTLDPALHTGPVTGPINSLFGGLVRLDDNMNVVPDIARDWRVSGDATVYTFDLRYNAYFHNGDWATTEDVVYSWERATDRDTGSSTSRVYLGDIVGVREKLAGEVDKISGVEALDLFTLRVTLTNPRPTFLQKLTHPVASVVDRSNVEAGDLAERPIGTGPYEFIAWGKGKGIVLGRNRRYHLERPKPFGVVHRFYEDDPLDLYVREQIDTVSVPLAHIERARDTRDDLYEDLVSSPTFCTHYLAFDTSVAPFDDVSIRQAFAKALDVDKIVSVVMKETVDRAYTLVPPGIPGHNATMTVGPFIPEVARSLLWGSTDRLAAFSPIPSAVDNPTIVWMWREFLGIDVRAFTGPLADQAGVWADTWCPDYLDAENYLETLLHSDGVNNRFGYSNPELDARLEEAAVIPDPSLRAEMYKQIESIARDDWVVVPLWHERRYELVQQYVIGYRPATTGVPHVEDIYFER